ncbi:MAG: hypothetical protein ABIS36_08520 [Chryseolinea sp.]
MKTTKFTLFFILLTSAAFAQDYAFKVLANKGSNEVKSGADWVPLKTGASLRSGDELKLSDNAYLGLVHSSGKPLEVKKAGSYKVAILESQVKTGSGVLTKYTDFILSSNTPEAKKNKLSATGAVDRGENYAIKVKLPGNQNAGIFNNTAIVSWDGATAAGPYTVTVHNMFDDELAKYETPETSFQLDLNDGKLSKENAVLVEIKSKSDAKLVSKAYLIKKLAPAEQATVKKSLSEISSDLSEDTALNKFILAGFYEQQNLYIDAITTYEQAIKLAPDVVAYKESYDDFLQRHGMK